MRICIVFAALLSAFAGPAFADQLRQLRDEYGNVRLIEHEEYLKAVKDMVGKGTIPTRDGNCIKAVTQAVSRQIAEENKKTGGFATSEPIALIFNTAFFADTFFDNWEACEGYLTTKGVPIANLGPNRVVSYGRAKDDGEWTPGWYIDLTYDATLIKNNLDGMLSLANQERTLFLCENNASAKDWAALWTRVGVTALAVAVPIVGRRIKIHVLETRTGIVPAKNTYETAQKASTAAEDAAAAATKARLDAEGALAAKQLEAAEARAAAEAAAIKYGPKSPFVTQNPTKAVEAKKYVDSLSNKADTMERRLASSAKVDEARIGVLKSNAERAANDAIGPVADATAARDAFNAAEKKFTQGVKQFTIKWKNGVNGEFKIAGGGWKSVVLGYGPLIVIAEVLGHILVAPALEAWIKSKINVNYYTGIRRTDYGYNGPDTVIVNGKEVDMLGLSGSERTALLSSINAGINDSIGEQREAAEAKTILANRDANIGDDFAGLDGQAGAEVMNRGVKSLQCTSVSGQGRSGGENCYTKCSGDLKDAAEGVGDVMNRVIFRMLLQRENKPAALCVDEKTFQLHYIDSRGNGRYAKGDPALILPSKWDAIVNKIKGEILSRNTGCKRNFLENDIGLYLGMPTYDNNKMVPERSFIINYKGITKNN
jgi:hypothetical protein